eukprot:gene17647-36201_t
MNTIPVAMLKNIEVLRDGASAQYGSDAIAGVVNLRLRTDKTGGEFTATYGQRRTEYDFIAGAPPAGATWDAQTSRKRNDGGTATVSGWKGLTLGESGYLTIAAEYKDRVFAEFLREYQAGRTPNPDILCNAEIKFKAFLDHAMRLGAEKIATGHYARVRERNGSFELLKGLDPLKDQSYFLHRLNQAQLSKTLFPVGELHKTEVRRIAAEINLPNAKKKDSTGICFIGERPFRDFLNRYIAKEPGPIKDEKGRVLGQHVGLSFYTLGQRQGLGIGGVKAKGAQKGGNDHAPWFVARKDMASNTLWVVQGHDHPWLLTPKLSAQDVSWVAGHAPAGGDMGAKTRYRQADAPCVLQPQGDSHFDLRFREPQWAVTPGQSAVIYDGDICLGGGVISSTHCSSSGLRCRATLARISSG